MWSLIISILTCSWSQSQSQSQKLSTSPGKLCTVLSWAVLSCLSCPFPGQSCPAFGLFCLVLGNPVLSCLYPVLSCSLLSCSSLSCSVLSCSILSVGKFKLYHNSDLLMESVTETAFHPFYQVNHVLSCLILSDLKFNYLQFWPAHEVSHRDSLPHFLSGKPYTVPSYPVRCEV